MDGESLRPHERPAFWNSVEYVVAVTFTVAGGARRGTAERRAERVADRLANTARAADVVAVSGSAVPRQRRHDADPAQGSLL
jgi:hypothetical protein